MSRRKTALQWPKNTTSISTLRQNWGSWRCSSARETLIPSPCERVSPIWARGVGECWGNVPPSPLPASPGKQQLGRNWKAALELDLRPPACRGSAVSIACLGNHLGGRRPPTPMPKFCKGKSRSPHTCVHTDTPTRTAVEACWHWQRWITTWRHTHLQRMYTVLPWITETAFSNCDSTAQDFTLESGLTVHIRVLFGSHPVGTCIGALFAALAILVTFPWSPPFPTCVNCFSFSSRVDGSCTCLG